MQEEQGVGLLGELKRVGKCYVQGQLCVLWLGIDPIKHMGKCLRHVVIFLKLTYSVFLHKNNIPFLSFCCFQVLILLGFSSLCVCRFKRKEPK